MNKVFKRILLVLAVATAVICSLAFTACGENNEAYSVELVYADGTPVNGQEMNLSVQWCLDVQCFGWTKIGADGKATAADQDKFPTLKEGEKLHVQINGLSKDYSYDENIYVNKPGSVKVTVTKK